MGSITLGAYPLDDEQLNGSDHDDELLIGSNCKEYQDTNKQCIYLLGKTIQKSQIQDIDNCWHPIINNQINMEQEQDRNIIWQQINTEELFLLNEGENSYTGMNKQESRTARGAIEKFIYITAFFITKTIVIYQDILLICSNFPPSLVFPEPAYQQYKDSSSVTKDISNEIFTLRKEEEIHCLFVYWYFTIMFELRYIKQGINSRNFNHYIYIDGYYITPLMNYTLDQIYKKYRTSATESFEDFIKRVMPCGKKIKDYFNKDEITKIRSFKDFDVSLLNKCLNIIIEYYIPIVNHSVADDYRKIKITCKEIKDIRNEMLHNLPKQDKNLCKEYYKNLNKLKSLLNDLVNLLEIQFFTSEIDELTNKMGIRFLISKYIPLSDFEMILILVILVFIAIIIFLLNYLYNVTNSL